MTRDNARELAVQIVYGAPLAGVGCGEFVERFFAEEHYPTMDSEDEIYKTPDSQSMDYIRSTVNGVFDNLEAIDGMIGRFSRGWSVSRISGTARAVLRVAVYEILYTDVPVAAAINSAVEIDKGYDEPDTVAFVNGVLGSVSRREQNSEDANPTANPESGTETGI